MDQKFKTITASGEPNQINETQMIYYFIMFQEKKVLKFYMNFFSCDLFMGLVVGIYCETSFYFLHMHSTSIPSVLKWK